MEAWLLNETLHSIAAASRGHRALVAFIDGESAYCRPPPAIVLRALWGAGVRGNDWLSIMALLGHRRGTLKINGELFGEWPMPCGVPQGGALSLVLFIATLIDLQRELAASGCRLERRSGRLVGTKKLAFVDDLAVVADTPESLQAGLDIVTRWDSTIRMRLNVGPTKSPWLCRSRGLLPDSLGGLRFTLGNRMLPQVTEYKYLGHWISAGARKIGSPAVFLLAGSKSFSFVSSFVFLFVCFFFFVSFWVLSLFWSLVWFWFGLLLRAGSSVPKASFKRWKRPTPCYAHARQSAQENT